MRVDNNHLMTAEVYLVYHLPGTRSSPLNGLFYLVNTTL